MCSRRSQKCSAMSDTFPLRHPAKHSREEVDRLFAQGEISEKQAHAMLQEMEAKLKRATDGDYKTAHEVEQIAGKAGYPRLYPMPVTR
jgi:polyhydroxyalkanoate synthesis regulator phasin